MRWFTRRGQHIPLAGPVTKRIQPAESIYIEHPERFDPAVVKRAMKIAVDSGRRAGDEHALANGRTEWDASDLEAATQMTQDAFYELIPESRGGWLWRKTINRDTAFAEGLRVFKSAHLYHGYVPSREPREEQIARLSLRHVPGYKEFKKEHPDDVVEN